MRRPILNIIWRNLLSPYINATNLNAMTNAINDNTQIIDEVVEDFDTLNSDVTENIQNLSERIHIQDGRIDVIAKTPEGGTTADAELRDIRVGADGTVYDNAGNAVRTQFDDVNNAINQLDNDKADNTEITRIDGDIDTINETLANLIKTKSFSGTSNGDGIIPLTDLPTANNLAIGVKLASGSYFATMRGLTGGNWYVCLENYNGTRKPNTAVTGTVYYIEQ